MAAELLGRVTAGRTHKTYEVKWDSYSKNAYVSYAGWTGIGKAYSAREAMNKAEAFLYNK